MIIFVVPVYNEEEVIEQVISELFMHFSNSNILAIVIDDLSKDSTHQKLIQLGRIYGKKIRVVRNEKNQGHGQSVMIGLHLALQNEFTACVTFDGDADFKIEDIKNALQKFDFTTGDCKVLEGIRVHRSEPTYRRVVSRITRVLISIIAKKNIRDANTPIRIYSKYSLQDILKNIPKNTLTPNIFISIIARKNKIEVIEHQMRTFMRKGSFSTSTWGKKAKLFPSWKFLVFLYKSLSQLLKFLFH